MSNEGRTLRQVSIALVVVLVLVVGAFGILYYDSQVTIGRLQSKVAFSQSVTLLPKTNVTLLACPQNGCDSENMWRWNFPYNMSLQYPGYLNVTIYGSNNSDGYLVAHWTMAGNGNGIQQWDYSAGVYPRTTPAWMIIPVIKGMVDLSLSILPNPLASWQTVSITYNF